jgi:hypothetical protein
MAGIGLILLIVAALGAVALIAWILAFGVESGVAEHAREEDPEPEGAPSTDGESVLPTDGEPATESAEDSS